MEKQSFTAGDSILFARGTSYASGFEGSGIAVKPITIAAYGIGGAVDAGQHLGYFKDFNDFSVPFGRKVDIGAHEYQGINMLYHIGKDVK